MSGTTEPRTDGSRPGEQVKQQASEAAQKAKEKLSQTAEELTDKARAMGAQQKNVGAEQVQEFARAVHTAARELEGRMPQVASLVDTTAMKLENAATALRQKSLNELMQDVTDFARREPVLFFGGAVLAGFALSRFLKASASQQATMGLNSGARTGTAPSYASSYDAGSYGSADRQPSLGGTTTPVVADGI